MGVIISSSNAGVPGLSKVKTDTKTITGDGTTDNPLALNEGQLNSDDKFFISSEEKDNIKTKSIYLTKNGLNGDFPISVFSYPKKIKITEVTCMSNCDNLSVSVGTETYDKTTLVDLEIPAETEISINDINILAGNDCGNVRLIFKEIEENE